MPYEKSHIPNTLKSHRKSYKLRQTDVAKILGFNIENRVSHWENGNAVPGLINLFRLCALYNLSPFDLYPELFQEIKQDIEGKVSKMIVNNG